MHNDRDSTHRVLMNFMVRTGGWHISFLEKDCRTVLPLKLTFAKEDKIRAMHDQCGSLLLEDKQALEHGLDAGRGKRYSWGYGACPDLAQHEIVWRLLDAEAAIGTELTEAFQIVPEQSTAAIILHHPQATYFNAAATRELTPA